MAWHCFAGRRHSLLWGGRGVVLALRGRGRWSRGRWGGRVSVALHPRVPSSRETGPCFAGAPRSSGVSGSSVRGGGCGGGEPRCALCSPEWPAVARPAGPGAPRSVPVLRPLVAGRLPCLGALAAVAVQVARLDPAQVCLPHPHPLRVESLPGGPVGRGSSWQACSPCRAQPCRFRSCSPPKPPRARAGALLPGRRGSRRRRGGSSRRASLGFREAHRVRSLPGSSAVSVPRPVLPRARGGWWGSPAAAAAAAAASAGRGSLLRSLGLRAARPVPAAAALALAKATQSPACRRGRGARSLSRPLPAPSLPPPPRRSRTPSVCGCR